MEKEKLLGELRSESARLGLGLSSIKGESTGFMSGDCAVRIEEEKVDGVDEREAEASSCFASGGKEAITKDGSDYQTR
jgi:hypothetical protein